MGGLYWGDSLPHSPRSQEAGDARGGSWLMGAYGGAWGPGPSSSHLVVTVCLCVRVCICHLGHVYEFPVATVTTHHKRGSGRPKFILSWFWRPQSGSVSLRRNQGVGVSRGGPSGASRGESVLASPTLWTHTPWLTAPPSVFNVSISASL